MCIAVRDHVDCFKLEVWIWNQRQAEEKVEFFTTVYLILVPGKKFIVENVSENIKASLWEK